MDGSLRVESKLGHGSTFSFTASFKLQEQQALEIHTEFPPRQGLKALLVDDSESARMVLQDMLESFGFEVYAAAGAKEAIALFQENHTVENPFSILIIDWKMPSMNGLELAEHLRQTTEKIPSVVMVTAFGIDTIKEATTQKTVDDYLLKPVNPSTLFDVINNLLHLTPTRSKSEVSSMVDMAEIRSQLNGRNVLLVDDNEMNLDLALELLEDVGIQVTMARNGLQAIEALNSALFDCVLMDIQMPEMDGLELLSLIRRHRPSIPVIMITAHGTIDTAVEAMKRGDLAAIGINRTDLPGLSKRHPDVVFKVIARGRDLPNDVLLAGKHVPDEVITKMKKVFSDNSDALIAAVLLGPDENQKFQGMKFIPTIADKDYDYIRKMYVTIGQPQYATFVGN
jgi:CheY-like chemotaxis protein